MQIIIPAAGMGNRLGSVTSDKTKAMIEVGGKTLIERCLDSAIVHSLDRIILIVGYEKDKLKKLLGNNYKGVDIVYVENNEYATTNNIYSVYLAKDYLAEDDTILIESDLIFDSKNPGFGLFPFDVSTIPIVPPVYIISILRLVGFILFVDMYSKTLLYFDVIL